MALAAGSDPYRWTDERLKRGNDEKSSMSPVGNVGKMGNKEGRQTGKMIILVVPVAGMLLVRKNRNRTSKAYRP
jgi:hypothetical protein